MTANKQDRARNDQRNLQRIFGQGFTCEDETQRRSEEQQDAALPVYC